MEVSEIMLWPILTPFILGLASIVMLFWYTKRKQQYWKDRGIPYVKPIPFFGNTFETFTKPMHEPEEKRYKKYGRIYGHFEGNRPFLSVGDPALLRNILVKDFHAFTGSRKFDSGDPVVDKMLLTLSGEDWKRVRTIITPTFTTGKIKKMLSIFKDCSKTCVKNFIHYTKEGENVDLKKIYGAFTMDVIASSAFSTKLDSHKDPNNKFVTAARGFFTFSMWRVTLYLLSPKLIKWFRVGIFPPKVTNFFKNATLEIIKERKRTGKKGNDFLQLLLDTAKEVEETEKTEALEKEDVTDNYGKEDSKHEFLKNISKKTLSLDELVAQCIIFFIAGYDTTATTLSSASYQLAINPDIQDRLIAEIDEALSATNGEITYDAVQSMKYLDNVISETLRLYPPLSRLEREAEEDYFLGDIGITIQKGNAVTVPVCAIHKDPKFFPDPEKFDPDRFTPEERAKRDPLTYMPFGYGPRNCIGMRFALVEMKVCLATVLSQFRFKRCKETKVPLEFNAGQVLLQAKDVTVKMEVRKDRIVESLNSEPGV